MNMFWMIINTLIQVYTVLKCQFFPKYLGPTLFFFSFFLFFFLSFFFFFTIFSVSIFNSATFGSLKYWYLANFQKQLFENTKCRDPSRFFHLLFRGKLFLQALVIKITFDVRARSFRCAKNVTRKMNFWSWLNISVLLLELLVLSYKVDFSMGSCWRIKLYGFENYLRAPGQHNTITNEIWILFSHFCYVPN